jgi:hypothetical protein
MSHRHPQDVNRHPIDLDEGLHRPGAHCPALRKGEFSTSACEAPRRDVSIDRTVGKDAGISPNPPRQGCASTAPVVSNVCVVRQAVAAKKANLENPAECRHTLPFPVGAIAHGASILRRPRLSTPTLGRIGVWGGFTPPLGPARVALCQVALAPARPCSPSRRWVTACGRCGVRSPAAKRPGSRSRCCRVSGHHIAAHMRLQLVRHRDEPANTRSRDPT